MRPRNTKAARTWSILIAVAISTTAFADEPGSDGSVAPRSDAGESASSGERVLDAPPSDEEEVSVPSEPRSTARSHRSRRRWTDGPRRIPTPSGRSLERARQLGLGTHEAGTHLLHHPARPEWKRAAGPSSSRTLRWPVDIGAIGRGFGFVRHDRPNVRHNGFDIATPRGMVIRAAAEGIVAYASNELRGYGSCILVVHPNGWVTLYAHADRITVQPGYRVRRGERIGFVGMTGRADGPHLHFELHVDGSAVDPRGYFEGEPWIEGRERLAVLRRDHGGHTYGHLGEIEADYGADVVPAQRAPRSRAARPSRPSRGSVASAEPREAPTPTRETSTRTREPSPTVATLRPRETAARPDPEAARTERVVERGQTGPAVATRRATEPDDPRPAPASSAARVTVPDEQRWLASGPTDAERRGLPSIRTSGFSAPIRIEAESTFRAGVLRYDAPVGTNVRASAPGRVAFIGRDLRGARTTVLVIHENGFISVYSGAMDTTVSVGATVALGDRLAIVRDATFSFWFEILDRGQALDPRPRFTVVRPEVVAVR